MRLPQGKPSATKTPSKNQMDSRLRGNDVDAVIPFEAKPCASKTPRHEGRTRWIPACAGMTLVGCDGRLSPPTGSGVKPRWARNQPCSGS
jgi:hypothetical protein